MSEILYEYLGGGFLPGVPSRDLTAADLERLRIDASLLDASPVYEKVKPKAKPKPAGDVKDKEK